MNELEVLEAWHPTDDGAASARASAARDALQGAMTTARPTAGRRLAGRALAAAAVTTALVAGGVAVAGRVFDDRIDGVRRVKVGAGALDVPAPGAPMNVLVVGSDSRAFVRSPSEVSAFGSPANAGGLRSDTMILVHVAGDAVTAVWLPRDLLVTDATGRHVQLNSFLDSGPEALLGAVRTLTGEPIDHYAEVDFPAFVDVVDDLGGVRMFVPAPMRDSYSGLNIAESGCTTFNGSTALAWSRSRHAEYLQDGRWVDAGPGADLDRIARQQALLRAIGAQTRARVGTDVASATEVLDTVVGSLKVDAAMDRDTIRSFVGHLVRPQEFTAATAQTELVPDAPGRLRLVPRPAGTDFFRWAAPPSSPATAPAAPTAPAAGDTC